MARKQKNRRSSMGPGEIMMFAAGALFCLVLITTALIGAMFARYSTSAAGSDSARVISFGNISITETGDFVAGTNKLLITPGVNITKKAVVTFEGSEAATYVFLEVSHSENWTAEDGKFSIGEQMQWQIAEGWEQLEDHVFYRELNPNETLSADIIKDGIITVNSSILESQLDELAGSISFRASVVQSHGFDNAAAAWASLKSKEVT